jgi:hypothetical protein
MALIPATIQVTWNANYAGPHRVCYRIQGGPPAYTCTDAATPWTNCAGGGLPCAYDIPIMVDNETCDPITYEGYVQPACEDVGSLAGRIAFPDVTFIPNPACKSYVVTCEQVGVDSAFMTDGGSGYTVIPAVTIVGGGGVGATATAVLGAGSVTGITPAGDGTGYVDGFYPACPLTGGSGAGATANITIAGGLMTFAILISGGTGYSDTDILNPDSGTVGVPGTPETIAVATDEGEIIGVNITAPGSGYTSNPTIVIDAPLPGPGTIATAGVRMTACGEPVDMHDCTGAGPKLPAALGLGETVVLCSTVGTPPIPQGHGIVEVANCLCSCEEVTISNLGGGDTVDVTYIDCNNVTQQASIAVGVPVSNVCIVPGSITYVEIGDSLYDLAIIGSCSV